MDGWMDGWIYCYHRQHNTMMSQTYVQKVKKCPGIQSLRFEKTHCLKHVLKGNYLFPTWFCILQYNSAQKGI
mgnify:CR=1 FL=1